MTLGIGTPGHIVLGATTTGTTITGTTTTGIMTAGTTEGSTTLGITEVRGDSTTLGTMEDIMEDGTADGIHITLITQDGTADSDGIHITTIIITITLATFPEAHRIRTISEARDIRQDLTDSPRAEVLPSEVVQV